MSEINQAFDVLGDPILRQAYDARHTHADQEEEPAPVKAGAKHTGAVLAPLGIAALTIFLALHLAVEKKGWWTLTWEFMSNGMNRPSSYSINWFLLTGIICVGLRVAWVVHRRLAKP